MLASPNKFLAMNMSPSAVLANRARPVSIRKFDCSFASITRFEMSRANARVNTNGCGSEIGLRISCTTSVLSSLAEGLAAAQKKKLVEAAVRLVEQGVPGYESVVKTARAADSEKTAEALRGLADRLRKKKKGEKAAAVLGLLDRGGEATAEDRFRRAMLELKKSRRDTKPASRAKDPCLRLFQELLDARVDVGAMLRKERSLENEERFYLGWHFLEEGEPLGDELLEEVIKRAPRTKLARMARNKKALEGSEA